MEQSATVNSVVTVKATVYDSHHFDSSIHESICIHHVRPLFQVFSSISHVSV